MALVVSKDRESFMRRKQKALKKGLAILLAVSMLPIGSIADVVKVNATETVEATNSPKPVATQELAETEEPVETVDAAEIENPLTGKEITLTKDTEIHEDFFLNAGSLDLNGYSLIIHGDLIQAGGTVKVNQGALTVKGDYRIQSEETKGNESVYTKSDGTLEMICEEDVICVEGDFVSNTTVDHSASLTNGKMRISGDVTVAASGSAVGFVGSGEHTIVLNGEEAQSIYFEETGKDSSRLQHLEVKNTSQKGVEFLTPVFVTGNIKDESKKVKGSLSMGKDTSFLSGYWNGDVELKEDKILEQDLEINGNLITAGKLTISKKLTIQGDYIAAQKGAVEMNEGNLIVKGNVEINGNYSYQAKGISMTHSTDMVYVYGDFQYFPYGSSTKSNGTLYVEKDLIANSNFDAYSSHKTIFCGDELQEIVLANGSSFGILSLDNHSEEGVFSMDALSIGKLERNGCVFRYADVQGIDGWTLQDDEIYEGDLVLMSGTLDLAGHTLTVKGDLKQIAGTVQLNGGKLIVQGDYRFEFVTKEDGEEVEHRSNGRLLMTQEEDYVLVQKDFVMASSWGGDILKNGVLEVKGDFSVKAKYSNYNFNSSEQHKLVLSGDKAQKVQFDNPASSNSSQINNLVIENKSEEGVDLGEGIALGGIIDTNGNYVKGNLWLKKDAWLTEKNWQGDVCLLYDYNNKEITGDWKIDGNLTFQRKVIISGDIEVSGNLIEEQGMTLSGTMAVDGDCQLKSYTGLVFEKGSLEVGGDFSMNGYLKMNTKEDFLQIAGNASFAQASLTNGIISLSGNVSFGGSFSATKENKIVLNGNSEQTWKHSSWSFANIEINNGQKEFDFGQSSLKISGELDMNGASGKGNLYIDDIGNLDCKGWNGTINTSGKIGARQKLEVFGNIYYSKAVINGELIVNGAVYLTNAVVGGRLEVNGGFTAGNKLELQEGQIFVKENATLNDELLMTHEKDWIHVGGDLQYNITSTEEELSAGVVEVEGDFNILGDFLSDIGHKIVLCGEQCQNVYSEVNGRLGTLELENKSEEGVCFETDINVLVLNTNGCVLEYDTQGCYGWTLSEDYVSEEYFWLVGSTMKLGNYDMTIKNDFYMSGGMLDLSGQTLTVEGDFILAGGILNITNGTLIVKGEFRLENCYWDTEKDLDIDTCSMYDGVIQMDQSEGKIIVEGEWHLEPYSNRWNEITKGTIELKGDLDWNGEELPV